MNINNKTIWITGASAGIGKALAIALAHKNATLILSARNLEKLNELKAELPNSARHIVISLDLTSSESISEAAKAVKNSVENIDILINNGGISQRSGALETQLDVQRQVMETNFFGTIDLTCAIVPSIIKNGGGMVVNIASVAGKVGGKYMSGYSASKHALIGYMDCLRAEEYANGLQVLNVCPGYIQTDISINALTANGEAYGKVAKTVKEGDSIENCIAGIINAIEKDKEEVILGKGLSRLAPTIKRFFPGLFRKIVAKGNFREA